MSGTLVSDVGYAGYFYHAVSGLNFTRHRAYDPFRARWLNRDPMGAKRLSNQVNLRRDEHDPFNQFGITLATPGNCAFHCLSDGGATPKVWRYNELVR